MTDCHIDFETKSDVDIRTRGSYVYFESQHTKPLMASYRFSKGPVRRWLPDNPCPGDIRAHAEAGGRFVGHNAGSFERRLWETILGPRYGWPALKISQWRCTLAQASALGLPRSLEKLGDALNLTVKKDKVGKALIKFFCTPIGYEDVLVVGSGDGWTKRPIFNDPDDHPVKFEQFRDYCDDDVLTESEADERMIPLSDAEDLVWQLDQAVNDRGIRIDRASAIAAIRLIDKEKIRLDAEMAALTGGAVSACTQVARLTAWCEAQGVSLMGVAKDDILEALDLIDIPAKVKAALLLRQEAGKSSTSKLKAFLSHAGADDRVRGSFVYHGAAPGRWSNVGVNFANLPRPRAIYDDAEIDAATLFKAFRTEEPQMLRDLYGPDLGRPLHLVSDAIRGFIWAAPGHDLIAVDYSGIQGALCAWAADEKWKLQAMREIIANPELPDLYRRTAAGIMNSTTEVITKKHWARQIGKVSELACFTAGTYVLTSTGRKRIVDVVISDLLWDGVEWVKHQGLIAKGVQPVVDVDGIKVSGSHQMLIGPHSWRLASELASDANLLRCALETGSANLPWLNRDRESFWSTARAALKITPWPYLTSEKGLLPAALSAPRSKPRKLVKNILVMMMSYLTTIIDIVFSAGSLPQCNVAPTKKTKVTQTTEVAGLKFSGEQIAEPSWPIWSRWRGGINLISNWIGRTLTATTPPAIFASLRIKKTPSTNVKLRPCKIASPNLKPVYDILNAGPRNRFTIYSDSGFLIVHNCGFQGGVAAFVSMAKNYNLGLKALHDLYPSIWAAAEPGAREKAVRRYENCLKGRQKSMTDVLSREGWIACELIKTGWRATNPAIAEGWKTLEAGMRDAVRNPGTAYKALKLEYLVARGFLWARLPSGRCMAYAAPKLKEQVWAKEQLQDGSWGETEVMDRDEAEERSRNAVDYGIGKFLGTRVKIEGATSPKVTALGVTSTTQKLERYAVYGGLATENMAMGLERDILVYGMQNCERAGYPIVFHTYDEAVAEVRHGAGSVAEMERLMLDLPPIYAGLPLAAHGWAAKRNHK